MINSIWRFTLISFAFVHIVSFVVVTSLLISSDNKTPKALVVAAYIGFLILSGLIYLVARRVRRMVTDMYGV